MIELDLLLVLVKQLLLFTFGVFDFVADLLLLARLLLLRLASLERMMRLEEVLVRILVDRVVVVLAGVSELEDGVGSHWEQVVVEEAFLLQLLDGKQGYVVLSIAFLNKDALWIYLLDDVFAGVWEVQNAVVVLDTLLVRFLD